MPGAAPSAAAEESAAARELDAAADTPQRHATPSRGAEDVRSLREGLSTMEKALLEQVCSCRALAALRSSLRCALA